jgi:hypothetical protein
VREKNLRKLKNVTKKKTKKELRKHKKKGEDN